MSDILIDLVFVLAHEKTYRRSRDRILSIAEECGFTWLTAKDYSDQLMRFANRIRNLETNMNTVEKIEEVTMFKASDGTLHPTMDAACDYQEALEFQQWCEKNICVGGEWSAKMVSAEILKNWRVGVK